MYVEDVIFYFTCGPWNKQVSLPQVSICSVEDIYFPSWKISEPCHWEKGHAKPAVRGSLCSAVTAAAAFGNSECRVCSHRTMHSKACLGSHTENKIYAGEFTPRGSSSCCNQHTEGEMQWYLANREASPETNSPMVRWWKCRALHKGSFKGPSKASVKKWVGGLESYALFQRSWLVNQPLENQEFCNSWSLPTCGKPSKSQSPLRQLTGKGREDHWKSLDGRTNSRPFSSEGKTDFCHYKDEALRLQQRFLWHGNQRLLLMHRVHVGSGADWRCCCIHRKTVFGLGSYQLWSNQRLGEHILQSTLYTFTLLSYSSPHSRRDLWSHPAQLFLCPCALQWGCRNMESPGTSACDSCSSCCQWLPVLPVPQASPTGWSMLRPWATKHFSPTSPHTILYSCREIAPSRQSIQILHKWWMCLWRLVAATKLSQF